MPSTRSNRLGAGSHGQNLAAPALVPPSTPHRPKSGAALAQLILSLEKKWHLGLKAEEHVSPAQMQTAAGKVKKKIQYLFYSSQPTLRTALDTFNETANECKHEERLERLNELLKKEMPIQTSFSRTDTPVCTRNLPPKSLCCRSMFQSILRHYELSLKSQVLDAESCYQLHAATPQLSQSRGRLDGQETKHDGNDSGIYIPAGSPTNADTDDESGGQRSSSPSPSPSPSCRSSNKRLKASSHVSLKTNHRKRRSDYHSPAGRATKLTRTIKEKEPAVPSGSGTIPIKASRSLFKEPNLRTATCREAIFASSRSANTSFETTVASSIDVNPTSAHTSFTSYDGNASQGFDRKSNSTFGSMDGDDIWKDLDQTELEQLDLRQHSFSVENFSRPLLGAPALATAVNSPSKLPYYIRELPNQNLFVDQLPIGFTNIPFFIVFICCRLSIVNGIPIEKLLQHLRNRAAQSCAKEFWGALSKDVQHGATESDAIWKAASKSFEGYTFKGKVSFGGISVPNVFKLELSPIDAEKSCQLQRMFGSDRFLYLAFPSFSENKPERFTSEQVSCIEEQWKAWLMREHSFLGRRWRAFHLEPTKRKSTQRKDDSSDKRVVLFATEGLGISKPMSIGDMLNTFMPLERNQGQNYCKAYARLDLALSRTIPTLVFKPSQIRRIPDKWSDDTPEATEFNDPCLDWSEKCKDLSVMNDGCARISVGAALLIWDSYRRVTGSEEPFPSAFQGRIRGAKGMWMVSAEAHTRDQAHLDIWIEIADSQSKFEPSQDDESDETYNAHRLTFNYVQHSFINGSTDLHISFIPILVDRGVEKDAIADLMIKHLDMERKQLLDMLTKTVRLHNWVTKQGSAIPVDGILPWQAALPFKTAEKVKLLLRAGLTPQESPYLARTLTKLVSQHQSIMEQKLRAPLGSATYLLGLADPENVLEPGEVHINFSSPFIDEFSNQTYRHLDGLEALIARQPACRPSDVQKVRVVMHPKLCHLRDVIVFPVRGQYPLAGKLQGGDYDGDTFWISWESVLVEPFKNAPAPLNSPEPAKYGIQKDHRRLNQVMDICNLSTIDGFLREAFNFRTAPSMLGKATNFLAKVAYNENKIFSPNINALCDVHDLLVDAPKQAYKFDDAEFNRLVRQRLRCGNPREPAHKQAMEASKTSRDMGETDQKTGKDYKYKRHNILDYLYFDIIRKHNTETRRLLSQALPKELEDDPILQQPFRQLKAKARQNKVLESELQTLAAGFRLIVQNWNRSLGGQSESSLGKYDKLVESCYASYCSLIPTSANSSDPIIAPLIYPYFGPNHPTLWETIRASAFYTEYPKKHTLVWQMAGRELTRLKAAANLNTYNVIPAIFADMKAKPQKNPKPEEGESDEDLEREPVETIA